MVPGHIAALLADHCGADSRSGAVALERAGWRVVCTHVSDEGELRSALDTNRYDLVLLNPSLPGTGAESVLRAIRQSDRRVPIIGLSDGLPEERVVMLVRAGLDAIVSTSDLSVLPGVVEQELTHRRDRIAIADDIEQAEARLRVVLNQLPAVVWTMDRDLVLTSAIGSRASVVDSRRGAVAPPETYRKALLGESQSFEFKDGDRVYDAWVEPMRDFGNSVQGIVGCALDVSQRRQLEKQFQAAQRMESIGRLAGGVAHDFNNVLTIIECYTKFLADEVAASAEIREDIQAIQEAARRAASLVSQLLAFSRRQVQELEVLDPNAVIEDVERMISRVLGEDIVVTARLDRTLRLVRADRAQLEQVLLNLAVNARDAMPDGGQLTVESKNIELDVGYAAGHASVTPGPYSMIAVTDNGAGMTDETKARLFEPFYTTKQDTKGTGLGLSTVYGIVKQSSGNIWVYSELGVGTTFKIYLPSVNESPSARIRAIVVPADLRGTETILLVEDDDALRAAAERTLRQHGYEVESAGNGAEALSVVSERGDSIDLVVTDVVMPGMGGRELGERLAQIRPALRVLYTSGYAEYAVVQHGVLQAGTSFLTKPYTPESLLTAVRRELDLTARASP